MRDPGILPALDWNELDALWRSTPPVETTEPGVALVTSEGRELLGTHRGDDGSPEDDLPGAAWVPGDINIYQHRGGSFELTVSLPYRRSASPGGRGMPARLLRRVVVYRPDGRVTMTLADRHMRLCANRINTLTVGWVENRRTEDPQWHVRWPHPGPTGETEIPPDPGLGTTFTAQCPFFIDPAWVTPDYQELVAARAPGGILADCLARAGCTNTTLLTLLRGRVTATHPPTLAEEAYRRAERAGLTESDRAGRRAYLRAVCTVLARRDHERKHSVVFQGFTIVLRIVDGRINAIGPFLGQHYFRPVPYGAGTGWFARLIKT